MISACRRAGVAPFMKQLGANVINIAGVPIKDRKGGDPAEWPVELRVQEFPRASA